MQMNKKIVKLLLLNANLLYAILKEKSHKREMKEKIIQIKNKIWTNLILKICKNTFFFWVDINFFLHVDSWRGETRFKTHLNSFAYPPVNTYPSLNHRIISLLGMINNSMLFGKFLSRFSTFLRKPLCLFLFLNFGSLFFIPSDLE